MRDANSLLVYQINLQHVFEMSTFGT